MGLPRHKFSRAQSPNPPEQHQAVHEMHSPQGHPQNTPTAPQESTFLHSLTASMSRSQEHAGGYGTPERRKQHASRIPLHPQMNVYEDNSSGMQLERLASLRMDSGDLSDARPPHEMHPMQRPASDPYGQRYWEPHPREHGRERELHLPRGPRQLMYEDEVSGPGDYGPPYGPYYDRMRGHHLGMAMSDPYAAHHMPAPRSVPRGRHHINHHSATEFTSFDPHMASDYRDGQRWQPATPSKSGMQRSMSEGMRLSGPPYRPPSRPQGPPESSTNSGKSGHKETSSGGRPSSLHESPDFAMIYAFLGSMFDPVCHMINHADVMQQMAPVDRETTVLILENCVHNLDTPYFLESYLPQIRMLNSSNTNRPPPVLSRDSSDYDVSTRHDPGRGPL